MKKKFVIVEHNNDKFTFEAILRYISSINTEVNSAEIWYEPRGADSSIDQPTGLKESLISAFKEIRKGKYDTIAVIWDLDNFTISERLLQVNNAFDLAINEFKVDYFDLTIKRKKIEIVSDFFNLSFDNSNIQIACYFVNYQGKGEIEDILKAIKSPNKSSLIADCVDSKLPECLAENEQSSLREKDLVKLWINHYVRYDTLKKNERKDENTKWENVMLNRSNIFDFDNESISEFVELKNFLRKVAQI